MSKDNPVDKACTGRQRNLMEPVQVSLRYIFDRSSTASKRNWEGAHVGASTLVPTDAVVTHINTMQTSTTVVPTDAMEAFVDAIKTGKY